MKGFLQTIASLLSEWSGYSATGCYYAVMVFIALAVAVAEGVVIRALCPDHVETEDGEMTSYGPDGSPDSDAIEVHRGD